MTPNKSPAEKGNTQETSIFSEPIQPSSLAREIGTWIDALWAVNVSPLGAPHEYAVDKYNDETGVEWFGLSDD